jgi:beta-galactosidase/evolved beta-galactosidase subunit alpha
MVLPQGYDRVEWFGRGPGENYADSKQASALGLYKSRVKDMVWPYLFPQETGNRTDVRCCGLTDIAGVGLAVNAYPLMEFTARYASIPDLEKAGHAYLLKEGKDVQLYLDQRQCGLGSGSCGPFTFEKYRIPCKPFSFRMAFRPWDRHKVSLNEAYR